MLRKSELVRRIKPDLKPSGSLNPNVDENED